MPRWDTSRTLPISSTSYTSQPAAGIGLFGNRNGGGVIPTIAGQKTLPVPGANVIENAQLALADSGTPSDAEDIYLQQAGALREAIARMYGYTTGGQIGGTVSGGADRSAPIDPLVNLQNSLMGKYLSGSGPMGDSAAQSYLADTLKQRSESQQRLIEKQASAMGAPDIYQGVIGANQAARDTLMSQAMATYKPIQVAMERQFQEQEQSMLDALSAAQREEEAAIRGMGRGATIKDFSPEGFDFSDFVERVGGQASEFASQTGRSAFEGLVSSRYPASWYGEALGPQATDIIYDALRRSVGDGLNFNVESLEENPMFWEDIQNIDRSMTRTTESSVSDYLSERLQDVAGGGSSSQWYDYLNPGNWDWEKLNPGSWF